MTHSEIKKKAYAIYEKRIRERKPGNDVSDWFRAEVELLLEEREREYIPQGSS